MASGGTIDQIEDLLRAGRHVDASRRLVAAAGTGEPDAVAALAHWRIAGNLVRRDLAEARRLLGYAADRGNADAALLHAGFLASGVGGAADWRAALDSLWALAGNDNRAEAQLQLLNTMALDPDGSPSVAPCWQGLSQTPFVAVAEGFMSHAECDYLRQAGEPVLQPSVVVDPGTGRMVPHPVRSSDAAMFGVYAEDLVINAINRRLAALSGTRPEQGEPLQLLRYRPGGEYRPHMDALPAERNQRIVTVLVYLSDDYEGGETSFPRTGLSFRGKTGDALLFRNTTPEGAADPMALHAGLPVTRGVKYIATRWIRAEAFTYPPPRPLVNI